MRIRLGTRASALARWQAEWVATRLGAFDIDVELVEISTQGDRQQESVKAIGAQGLFTKEIQVALLDKRIDLAVHSLKDLPTDDIPGLCLAAVPERAAVDDVLLSRGGETLGLLPEQSVVGTGSLRRRAQLLYARPDLRVRDIRGNVDTRIRKLREGQYDAIILAAAGLQRLALADQITQRLRTEVMLPAVGQGALGLETRRDDEATEAVAVMDHAPTHQAVLAERSMLEALQGGCLAPIGAWGRIEEGRLTLTGRVIADDGSRRIDATQSAAPESAVELGLAVADELAAKGAAGVIQASRETA